ncbi:OmpH family outer membrane protein [Pelagibius sp.]|uniref:OmpH family outer membrane protein n=1 Tax=Pelagibius sp. TaxID=1931238 RepID=UPI003B50788A
MRFAAALVFLSIIPVAANAQVERAPLIGVIDVQAVLRESVAVKTLAQRVETARVAAQQAMQDREVALREADLDLAQRRSSLSAEDYRQERSSLEAEGVALQREMQAERRRLDQLFSQGMAQVQQVLQSISQEIAIERDLDLVLAKTTVIIVKSEFDLTEEALRRLNSRLTDVSSGTAGN